MMNDTPGTPQSPKPHITVEPHQLVLVKRNQRWVFRYGPGEESAVLRQIAAAASNPESGFDWFDAAVLSHQMGSKIQQQLTEIAEE